MTIKSKKDNDNLTLAITGRIDNSTAPQFEETLKASYDGITELVFDFQNLEYISSAGIRVLLSAQKKMNQQGSMKIMNVSEAIMEIFALTGFTSILNIG